MTDETPVELPRLQRRHKQFADHYLTGISGSEAMRRINYQGNAQRCSDAAYRILKRPEVRAYLAERRKDLEESTGIRQERVLRRLNAIVEGSAADLYDETGNLKPIGELAPEVALTIAGIEVEESAEGGGTGAKRTTRVTKVKQLCPIRAAEGIARQLGWNKDMLELKGKIAAQPPIIQIVPYDDEPATDQVPGQPPSV